jgi:hypothetical protein
MKTSFLVTFAPMTRVVVEVADPENITESELEAIAEAARNKILEHPEQYVTDENIDGIGLDTECPYGTLDGK